MALFGRESQADIERALRIKAWLTQRSPFALFAMLFGILAVIDSITMVIGLFSGVIAIVLSFLARKDLREKPDQKGHRLATTALILGMVGIALSATVYFILH